MHTCMIAQVSCTNHTCTVANPQHGKNLKCFCGNTCNKFDASAFLKPIFCSASKKKRVIYLEITPQHFIITKPYYPKQPPWAVGMTKPVVWLCCSISTEKPFVFLKVRLWPLRLKVSCSVPAQAMCAEWQIKSS